MPPKRQRRYYELLRVIKAPEDKPPEIMERIFEHGRRNHAEIEAHFPAFKVPMQTFDSPELDFVIGFHPDLYDAATKTVYEIKSAAYFKEQERYALVQASGYFWFLKAERVVFLLYNRLPDRSLVYLPHHPSQLCPWEALKKIMTDSDKLLLAHEALAV